MRFVKRTFSEINVILLDINKTDFGINLLELPEHRHEDRDVTVSFHGGSCAINVQGILCSDANLCADGKTPKAGFAAALP